MGIFAHEMGSRVPQQPEKCAKTRGFALFSVQMGEICVKRPDLHFFGQKRDNMCETRVFCTFTGEIPGQARNEGGQARNEEKASQE